MQLVMTNREQLGKWLEERRKLGRDVVSQKGAVPEGETDSDGDPITYPVNIAWQDTTTKEIFAIEYELR